ncbi:prenyltransferase/squalene oxidase repeat-containing protein [Thermococcus sp.]|uniref:prenyltransferase/squalene oxidase repeat-containing protein n=1 Tax=Thermococcus sp. TaxID=35749 RepID=UPI00262DFCBF|nr:prenyltransferase/squalene oxidase repeat-containing protein [Thermococcus sp.]
MNRIMAVLMVILLVIPGAYAGQISWSVNFLEDTSSNVQSVREMSLVLMALSGAQKAVGNTSADKIDSLTMRLLSLQNSDGGWGYLPNETSNVVDTSYALIALLKAEPYVSPVHRSALIEGVSGAVSYLLTSSSDGGWGYVLDSAPAFYPTVMAVWALGEYGYYYTENPIKNAVGFLLSAPSTLPAPQALALKVIALHAVNYPVSEDLVSNVEELLRSDSITTLDRTMLTYALELVRPLDFTTSFFVSKLLELANVSGDYAYWLSSPTYPLTTPEVVKTSAFALMAVAYLEQYTPQLPAEQNPYVAPCSALESLQNDDGGWPLVKPGPSNEKATYYALLALKYCVPTNESVEKALSWAREALTVDGARMVSTHRFSPAYFYALETLLHFNALSAEEKEKAINDIISSQLPYGIGLWGNNLGPQPYQTALAVRALFDLGVPANDSLIQRAVKWVLGTSNGGWGIYVSTPYFSYMLRPDVMTTVSIIEALRGIVPKDELKPHAEWLVSQRVDGGWAYWKPYYDPMSGRVIREKPTVELTVRVTDVLAEFGYNFSRDTLNFVIEAKQSGEINGKPVETAFAVMYLSRYKFVPKVTLDDVRLALGSELFTIVTSGLSKNETYEIVNSLVRLYGNSFVVSNTTEIGEGYYLVVAPYGSYNVSAYNPYLNFRVENGSVVVANYTAPVDSSIVLVPGYTPDGNVLFVFYSPSSRWMAVELFTTGFIRYIRGDAMVLTYKNDRFIQKVVG